MSAHPQGTVAAVSRNDVYSFTKPTREEIVLLAGLGVEGDVHAGVTVKHRGRVAADASQPNLRQVHLIHAELFEEVREQGFEVAAGHLGENVTTSGLDLLSLPRGTILRFGPAPTHSAGRAGAGAVVGDAVVGGAVVGDAVVGDAAVGDAAIGAAAVGAAAVGDADGVVGAAASVAPIAEAAAKATLDAATAAAVATLVEVAQAVSRDNINASAGSPDGRATVVITGLRNPCGQINGFRPGLLKQVLGRDDDGNLVRKAGIMGVVLRGGPVRTGDPISVELPGLPYLPLERV